MKLVRAPGPKWLRWLAGAAGAAYLAAIFVGGTGSSLPSSLLSRALLYFTQVACLFPLAAEYSIEYRVSAYSCRDRRFQELDYRPYFPLRPDDKENRFQRLGQFYRTSSPVMRALEDHLVERHNRAVSRGENAGDGVEGRIGGILVMSLRIPLPALGERFPRYAPVPLADVPREWQKHYVEPTDSRGPLDRRRRFLGARHRRRLATADLPASAFRTHGLGTGRSHDPLGPVPGGRPSHSLRCHRLRADAGVGRPGGSSGGVHGEQARDRARRGAVLDSVRRALQPGLVDAAARSRSARRSSIARLGLAGALLSAHLDRDVLLLGHMQGAERLARHGPPALDAPSRQLPDVGQVTRSRTRCRSGLGTFCKA
jgi:hypothetical protein